MEEKGVNNRIIQIMHDEGLSKNAFGKRLGVSQTAITQLELNNNFPSFKIIIEILKKYPRINSDWLLLGKGPKYRQEYTDNAPPPSVVNEPPGVYSTGNLDMLQEALAVVRSKSAETDKLIDVVKETMDEVIRYGARMDRILSLMDKLYDVKFIEPKDIQ